VHETAVAASPIRQDALAVGTEYTLLFRIAVAAEDLDD
jgi:hypothetical protein